MIAPLLGLALAGCGDSEPARSDTSEEEDSEPSNEDDDSSFEEVPTETDDDEPEEVEWFGPATGCRGAPVLGQWREVEAIRKSGGENTWTLETLEFLANCRMSAVEYEGRLRSDEGSFTMFDNVVQIRLTARGSRTAFLDGDVMELDTAYYTVIAHRDTGEPPEAPLDLDAGGVPSDAGDAGASSSDEIDDHTAMADAAELDGGAAESREDAAARD
jgi:hypothetical protein